MILRVELALRMRDKSFWLEVLLLPVVVTTVMGLALGGVGRGKLPTVRVALVATKEDNVAAQVLNAALSAAGSYETTHYSNLKDGRNALRSRKVDALIQVPDIEPSDIDKGTSLKATIERNPETEFSALLVAQIAEATFKALSAELRARQAAANLLAENGLDPTPAWLKPTPVPVAAQLQTVPMERFDVLAAQFAGLAIFFSLLSAFRLMGSIFGAHRSGLNLRMAALPVPGWVMATGYIAVVAIIAAAQTAVVLALTRMAFGVKWGPLLPLLLATLLSALASAGVALLLVSLPGSPAARGLIGMLVVLGGSLIGGALVPLDAASSVLRTLGALTLHYWVTGLFKGLARGVSLSELTVYYAVITIYGLIALALASGFLRRRRPTRA